MLKNIVISGIISLLTVSTVSAKSRLNRSNVDYVKDKLWEAHKKMNATKSDLIPAVPIQNDKIQPGYLTKGDVKMPYYILTKGQMPKGGWPLYICLHGGGKAPAKVNDREWAAQKSLATHLWPHNALYFIPRMAKDSDGRWWFDYHQEIFERSIKNSFVSHGVNPNKVYITGISEGGYGTFRLGPFMPDYFAAVGSMAAGGVQKNCPPINLLNTPFRNDVGELDNGFKRVTFARDYAKALDELSVENPGKYIHSLNVQKGRGHGIDYKANVAWLSNYTRDANPNEIVWKIQPLHNRWKHDNYWLSWAGTPNQGDQYMISAVKKQNFIELKTEGFNEGQKIIIGLNLEDYSPRKKVVIKQNGKVVFAKIIEPSVKAMRENLSKRGDINFAFPVNITIPAK